MRADAVRNQRRIFEEARSAVGAGQTDITLNELARRAGVGVGTVYRQFPTQRAMLEAVVLEGVQKLAQAAERAGGESDPEAALAGFLREGLMAALQQPGLFGVLIASKDENPETAEAKRTLGEEVARLLGRLDPGGAPGGMNAEYLLKMFCGLIHALTELPETERERAADVYVATIVRGL